MSIKVMSRVWEYSRARHAELLVILALADWSNDTGESWPSIPKLAQKARLTERQTRRALNGLETIGEIRRQRTNGGRNRQNHYFVIVPENPDKITLTKLQGKNNSVIDDRETLVKMSGALNRHRTVNKGVTKKRSRLNHQKRDPRVKEFIDWFATEYKTRFDRPYHVKGERDGILIKRLLCTFDLPTLKRCAIALLESDDDFLCRTDRGIGILSNQINKLAGMIDQDAGCRSEATSHLPEPLEYDKGKASHA